MHPALFALGLFLLACGRIEYLHPVAALVLHRTQPFIGLVDQFLAAGVAFAKQAAADTDSDVDRLCAGLEDAFFYGFPQFLGQLRHRGVLAFDQQHGKHVVGDAAGHITVAQLLGNDAGQAVQQGVGSRQAHAVERGAIAIGLDDQQGLVRSTCRSLANGLVHRLHHVRTIEQAGDVVTPAQFVNVHLVLAEDDLQAGLALVAGIGKMNQCLEFAAIGPVCLDLELFRRRLSAGNLAQQLLEVGGVVGGNHVQQGHAFDFLEGLHAEQVEVGLVGAHMHAFMDVGDGIVGRVEKGVAAALGFAQCRLQLAHAAAHVERLEYAPDHGLELLGMRYQADATDAHLRGLYQQVVVGFLDQGNHGDVLARCSHLLAHGLQVQLLDRHVHQHEVRRCLARQGKLQLLGIGSIARPHGNTGIAQKTDDLFGLVKLVLHEQYPYNVVLFHLLVISGVVAK